MGFNESRCQQHIFGWGFHHIGFAPLSSLPGSWSAGCEAWDAEWPPNMMETRVRVTSEKEYISITSWKINYGNIGSYRWWWSNILDQVAVPSFSPLFRRHWTTHSWHFCSWIELLVSRHPRYQWAHQILLGDLLTEAACAQGGTRTFVFILHVMFYCVIFLLRYTYIYIYIVYGNIGG